LAATDGLRCHGDRGCCRPGIPVAGYRTGPVGECVEAHDTESSDLADGGKGLGFTVLEVLLEDESYGMMTTEP
jgi:hypothetical protein